MTDQSRTRRTDRRGNSTRSSDSSGVAGRNAQEIEPRDRSRDDQQQDRGSSNRRYLFIDASADRATSGEAVRVHAMREAHRSRRERQGSQSQRQSHQGTAQDEMIILDPRNTSRPTSTTPPITAVTDERLRVPPSTSLVDWPSIVRAGVPQFSLESMQELHHLAEGYLRSLRLVQPDVLHLCRGDFLSMSAYLALAALQLASNEQEPANVASVQFEARALELLRLRITETARMHTDTTIVAVLLLSQLEQKANAESALFHRNALKRLVQDRGGLGAIREQNVELSGILSEAGFAEAIV